MVCSQNAKEFFRKWFFEMKLVWSNSECTFSTNVRNGFNVLKLEFDEQIQFLYKMCVGFRKRKEYENMKRGYNMVFYTL